MKKQNYKESKKILEEIKKAKKILLSCHRSPDPDSVASNLALYQVLTTDLQKKVKVVSPDKIHPDLGFLVNYEKIEVVDYQQFDFSELDLFIVLDSSTFDQVIGIKNFERPDIPLITIDHHATNTKYGDINLIDTISSTCEILFNLFEDWEISAGPELATALLSGIYSDSVSFQIPSVRASSLKAASRLIEFGADKEEVILRLFRSYDFNLVKFWSRLLERMEIDKSNRFVWTAVPFEDFSKYGSPAEAKSLVANIIFENIKGTDFGVVMVEQRPNVLNISFRSRTDFDVSRIAKELGGSGHKGSAGAWIEFEEFDNAVDRVLKVSRKYAKKSKKSNN